MCFTLAFPSTLAEHIHLQRGEIRNAAIRMQRKSTLIIFKIGPFYNSLPLSHLHSNVLSRTWKGWSLSLSLSAMNHSYIIDKLRGSLSVSQCLILAHPGASVKNGTPRALWQKKSLRTTALNSEPVVWVISSPVGY